MGVFLHLPTSQRLAQPNAFRQANPAPPTPKTKTPKNPKSKNDVLIPHVEKGAATPRPRQTLGEPGIFPQFLVTAPRTLNTVLTALSIPALKKPPRCQSLISLLRR